MTVVTLLLIFLSGGWLMAEPLKGIRIALYHSDEFATPQDQAVVDALERHIQRWLENGEMENVHADRRGVLTSLNRSTLSSLVESTARLEQEAGQNGASEEWARRLLRLLADSKGVPLSERIRVRLLVLRAVWLWGRGADAESRAVVEEVQALQNGHLDLSDMEPPWSVPRWEGFLGMIQALETKALSAKRWVSGGFRDDVAYLLTRKGDEMEVLRLGSGVRERTLVITPSVLISVLRSGETKGADAIALVLYRELFSAEPQPLVAPRAVLPKEGTISGRPADVAWYNNCVLWAVGGGVLVSAVAAVWALGSKDRDPGIANVSVKIE